MVPLQLILWCLALITLALAGFVIAVVVAAGIHMFRRLGETDDQPRPRP